MLFPETESDVPAESNFLCGVVEGFYGRPWTTVQRKRLFNWMKDMGMNTYLYAPKDDCKHRMYWRELYSIEEADALTQLIEAAESKGISFVYAISPGLDICYSSSKEVTLLKKKLQQVASFGCMSFAILFDDIEIEMCSSDKEKFQSFAQAQVSVTNEVFQHLNQPTKFLFCPTEYCSTRAVPNVSASEYLNTIGSKLLPGIDIMWTGPKVVSKNITVQSIEELTVVLRRPPVIWDNIHANDYDQKRLFLGPYDGRSTDLIPHLKGVMTNPNCEFEANYIAFHTLCQWYKSNMNGTKKDAVLSELPLTADIRLETESDYGSDEESPLFLQSNYKPRKALAAAIIDWIEEINSDINVKPPSGVLLAPTQCTSAPTPGVSPCMVDTITTNSLVCNTAQITTGVSVTNVLNPEGGDNFLHALSTPLTVPVEDSGIDTDLESPVGSLEPMDCVITPGSSPCEPTLDSIIPKELVCDEALANQSKVHCDVMQVDTPISSEIGAGNSKVVAGLPVLVNEIDTGLLTVADIYLLVDLFYLPFEHGSAGLKMLEEFQWLKMNAHIMSEVKYKPTNANQEQVLSDSSVTVAEWKERTNKLIEITTAINKMAQHLCNSANEGLVYDLFPYVWDLLGIISILESFVQWIALGEVPYVSVYYMQRNIYSWANSLYKQAFMSGDQEPWVYQGGLQGELQRLLPLDTISDLLMPMLPPKPNVFMLRTRPYAPADEPAVNEICHQMCNESSALLPHFPDMAGDKLVGVLLNFSQEYCFVIEGMDGVCGYMCCVLDTNHFNNKLTNVLLSSMEDKSQQNNGEVFHKSLEMLPSEVRTAYPSVIHMALLPSCFQDPRCPRQSLAVTIATLKANGSCGVHVTISRSQTCMIDWYTKLGFMEIASTASTQNCFMGRTI